MLAHLERCQQVTDHEQMLPLPGVPEALARLKKVETVERKSRLWLKQPKSKQPKSSLLLLVPAACKTTGLRVCYVLVNCNRLEGELNHRARVSLLIERRTQVSPIILTANSNVTDPTRMNAYFPEESPRRWESEGHIWPHIPGINAHIMDSSRQCALFRHLQSCSLPPSWLCLSQCNFIPLEWLLLSLQVKMRGPWLHVIAFLSKPAYLRQYWSERLQIFEDICGA